MITCICLCGQRKPMLGGRVSFRFVDQLIEKHGVAGLYSRTLFNYDQRFIDQMGKSIEMGRSVIAQQYQKSMSALLLLWKGIATFVHQNPDYTHLFGPVSISNDYSDTARQLLAQSMTLHHYDNNCAEYVTPSNHFPSTTVTGTPACSQLRGFTVTITRNCQNRWRKGVPCYCVST